MIRALKRFARTTIRSVGLDVRRTQELPPRVPGIRHTEIFPGSTYSPWLGDRGFEEVFDAIETSTLVDRYRCYELWQLVAEAAKLGAGDLLEVGVWRGGTGALIAKCCKLVGILDDVHLCDTFTGVVKAGPNDGYYRGGEHADTTMDAVVTLCESLKLDNVRIHQGVFPEDTGHHVSHRQFRFCHIDVDVYTSSKDIVEWIWPRLVPGGIIVFDDYGSYSCSGITLFVNEERLKPDRLVIHNLNGHAVVIKRATQGPVPA